MIKCDSISAQYHMTFDVGDISGSHDDEYESSVKLCFVVW
jgi:hypothetical protein